MTPCLLSIDYSTTCTGYAVYHLDGKLKRYGIIKPFTPNKKACKLAQTLEKLENIASQILDLVLNLEPQYIVIEEINRGKNRLGQKTLDGGHFILYNQLVSVLERIVFLDSDGKTGWRTKLNLRLSEQDKLLNKQRKAMNKSIRLKNKKKRRDETRIPLQYIITKKTLACRFVNAQFNLTLNDEACTTDGDKADAIGLGYAYLKYVLK